eukprot:CAMPEP_0114676626 /NCGR_PEP_ID=MMETSP0191-20121206/49485_1 /TAXON_ID=126664 /ORGANISM="Sorites sp." /LENGTH=46 /DNA_ID= /DNA_START= /DNA_END= /DNA_ORIENTATION=
MILLEVELRMSPEQDVAKLQAPTRRSKVEGVLVVQLKIFFSELETL